MACIAFIRLRVPVDSLIPLTKTDERKLSSLLTRPYLTHQPNWKNEVSDVEEKSPRVESNVRVQLEYCFGTVLFSSSTIPGCDQT